MHQYGLDIHLQLLGKVERSLVETLDSGGARPGALGEYDDRIALVDLRAQLLDVFGLVSRSGVGTHHAHGTAEEGRIQLAVVHHERSEEHTSELQSLMRISYAVFCLKKKKTNNQKAH